MIAPVALPSIIAWPNSEYGVDSLMKRWPAPFTMNWPGIIRSFNIMCLRPVGKDRVGNHQASSIKSTAAPVAHPRPYSVACVADGAETLVFRNEWLVLAPHLLVVLEAPRRDNHAAARLPEPHVHRAR